MASGVARGTVALVPRYARRSYYVAVIYKMMNLLFRHQLITLTETMRECLNVLPRHSVMFQVGCSGGESRVQGVKVW